MEQRMKTVIIGGVAGGASCAARLRRLDEKAEIVLLERGEFISYANCGLPYHVGGVIREERALLLLTPEAMKKKFNVDVRVKNEAVSIDRAKKTVTVRRADTGETYEESYDALVLATGSSPVRPPIPGIDSPRVRTLWTVPDAAALRAEAVGGKVKSAVVVGGGFIGLETAENLRQAGLDVTLVEALDQVMTPLDFEMAQLLHEELEENGVRLLLGDGVDAFADEGDETVVRLKSGKAVRAGLVVLAIGVRPNSALAKDAGLALTERGGVVTDASQRTSDPSVYAVGDVTAVEDFVFGGSAMVPLAGPANKQGRIAADAIAGLESAYRGTQGSFVAKVFHLTAAATGANEKTLLRRGLKKGEDYLAVTIMQNSHAGYYPGAAPMTLKLLFAPDGTKIFGAQIVGRDGADKRIDTIGTAMRLGGTAIGLKDLELAYAPPYSSAKDPVNMLGFTAENVVRGLARISDWDAPDRDPEALLLDVREDAEVTAWALPGAAHIPLGQLRERLGELDRTRRVLVFCAIGVRAYNAARILTQNGFENVEVYPGGTRFYRSTHFVPGREEPAAPAQSAPAQPAPAPAGRSVRLDCSGLQCPGPLLRVFESMKDMKEGETLDITASDPGFLKDIEAWCRRTGNTLLSRGEKSGEYVASVRKGGAAPAGAVARETPEGKTIIVFSGDLDKVLASFIIANGAAAMGRKVTMFFTFWGLTVLRRTDPVKVRKTPVEAMFGKMLPRGSGKLKLSRMNMGGMGTAMMKKIMNDKNVDSLEELIRKAIANGVRILACSMSMDVMGIKPEELIDGVEIGGVGTYLGEAEESNVNLFI